MNNRTEAKLTDLSGMQKAIEEILIQAWERGRKYGRNEERKKGEWIYKEFDVESGISRSYWCSNCGEPKSQWCDAFCQRCGADMRKGEKNETNRC